MRTQNIAFGCAALCLALLAGCGRDTYYLAQYSVSAPQPPPILTTPAVFLLTNNTGFAAAVKLDEPRGASTGRLFAHGTKFLYVPNEKKMPKKYGPAGGFSFIWDAAEAKGFVLSEALQGYAPISHSGMNAATNVNIQSGPGSITLTAEQAKGTVKFEAVPAPGRAGLPEQISGGSPGFKAGFDPIRAEPPPEQMFKVPSGFTAYSSAESMVDELAVRYRNLKRKTY